MTRDELESEVAESMTDLARDDFDFVEVLIEKHIESMTDQELEDWLSILRRE